MQQYQDSYHQLITIEDDGFNNTLAPWNVCPNANNAVEDIGFNAAANWTEIYLKKTVPRLQKHLKGITLDVNDVQAMQDLCAYETVALGFSTFCDLFTEEEWKGYEYAFGKSEHTRAFRILHFLTGSLRSGAVVRFRPRQPCYGRARHWLCPAAGVTTHPNASDGI